mmetsp:Transcript_76032/g.122807  ORF Transcript_76032/g.122807 Transcript_76032/m.122807 type:complete len:144 (-) Transcript_76032:100-531(-)
MLESLLILWLCKVKVSQEPAKLHSWCLSGDEQITDMLARLRLQVEDAVWESQLWIARDAWELRDERITALGVCGKAGKSSMSSYLFEHPAFVAALAAEDPHGVVQAYRPHRKPFRLKTLVKKPGQLSDMVGRIKTLNRHIEVS